MSINAYEVVYLESFCILRFIKRFSSLVVVQRGQTSRTYEQRGSLIIIELRKLYNIDLVSIIKVIYIEINQIVFVQMLAIENNLHFLLRFI